MEATQVSIDEWIKKKWYMPTMEYNSTLIKVGNFDTYTTTCMSLKDTMQREISQSQKDKNYMIPFICCARVVRFIETESRIVVARSWGSGESYC